MAEKLPKYLTRRKGDWLWVQIAVPDKCRDLIEKTILRKYLNTKDVAIAEIEMGQYITQFKRMISAAEAGRTLPPKLPTTDTIDPISKKALEIRRQGHYNEEAIETIASSLPLHEKYARMYSSPKMPGVAEAMQHFDFVDTAMGRKTPILAFLDDFIANYKGRAEHTVETRRKDVLRLANWLREKDKLETVEEITRPVAVQFKRDLHHGGAKRATVNKTIGSLRQYWKHLLDDGIIDGVSPWTGITVTKLEAQGSENPSIRAYTDDEIATIFAAAPDPDTHDSMMFAALTGARRRELYTLKSTDCDRGMMFLRGTKNESSVRVIPIHSALEPIIKRLSERRKPPKSLLIDHLVDKVTKKPGDAAGKRFGRYKDKLFQDNEGLNYHSFRHWASLKMKYAEIPETKISDVLGHEHQGTTSKIYAAIMKKAKTIRSLDMLNDLELKELRNYLSPAIEAIKLPFHP